MLEQIANELENLKKEATSAIEAAKSTSELAELDIKYLGRKGSFAAYMSRMKDLSNEERPSFGKIVNEAKTAVSTSLSDRRIALLVAEDTAKLKKDRIDVTLPGRFASVGSIHPTSAALKEISDIFLRLGFTIEEGPDVEDEWHNFDALNIPDTHPARDVQDTFFVKSPKEVAESGNKILMRTHTSPVQARTMEKQQPPIRFIAPGRVYRNERIDASHYTIFHQIEGLYVDKNVTFAQLKGTLMNFAKIYYGPQASIRLRPGFFPFTEPSAEVDITCTVCGGKGCSVCKGTGWVEVLGAGMVHPNVFKAAGYTDPDITGYAFGLGVERLAILKYRIDDIRLFYDNDIRFLEQFI